MTELFALGLVDCQKEGYYDNSKMQIELKKEYLWCLGRDFRHLRQGFFLTQNSSNNPPFDKRSSNQGDKVKKRSAKLEEKGTPHTHAFFQETYDRLEKLNPEGKVNESMLKQELVTSGNFTAGEAAQIIKDMIWNGNIQELGFDILGKKLAG